MPMLDAFIPEGALSPGADRVLLAKLTDLLLEHEGVDPSNEMGRHLAWVFVHRPHVYVAGEQVLAARRRQEAEKLLAAAGDRTPVESPQDGRPGDGLVRG